MKFLKYFLFLINLLAPVCLISMEGSDEVKASEYLKNTLKIELDGKKLELPLANVWRHITSFRLNEGKVSGFHFFSNKGLSSYEFKGQFCSYELFEITPKLWVISKSNKSGFRVCYIVYDGKLIDEPKTFFPSSNFSQDNFLELIQKLPSKISTQRVIYDGLHKVYEVVYDYNQKFYIKVVIGSHPNFFIKTIYPVSKEVISESEAKQTGSDLLLCLNEINNKISLRLKNKNFEKTNESLVEAVSGETYDISKIIKLLSNYINVDERNKFGKTALMIAAAKGWLEVVSMLIDYGANVNLVDNNKVSVLNSAIYSCDYLTFLHIFKKDDVKKLPVTTLIDMVGNINKSFSQDKFQDFKLIVSNLIDAGFNIDSVDSKGFSALSYCATICSLDLQVAEFFIQCNASIENGDFLNKLADKYNNVGFKKLIQRYKEIKKDYIDALKNKHFYDCDDRVLEFLYSLFMFDFKKSESLLKNNLKINLNSDSGFEILKRVIETNNYDLFVLLNLYDSHDLVNFYQNCLDYSRKLNVSKQIQDLLLSHLNICEALSQKEIDHQNRLKDQKQKQFDQEKIKKREIALAYEASVKNDKLTEDVKDFLFSLKNSDQSNLTKPFLYAVEKKSKNIIDFFLNDLKFDLEKNSESVLKIAFQSGDSDILKLLIASRNTDSQKNLIYGLLILVLDNSNSNNNNIHKSKISLEDVIEIANAFNINDFIFYSLMRVITDRTRLEGNKENLINSLSDFIYLLNKQQMWDLLQKSLEFDDSTFILLVGKFKALLSSEDIFINFLNNQNNHGQTLLIFACQFDRVESAKYLLNCNVNKDIKDFDNKSCLSYCRKNYILSKIINDEIEKKKIPQSKANLEAAQNQHAQDIKNKWIAERKEFEQEKSKLKESGLSDWLVLFKVVNQNLDFKKFVSIDDFKNCKDDINAVDEQGYTVAHLIAESEQDVFEFGNDSIFELVISQPDFNFEKLSGKENTTILHCACMNNRVEIARHILVKYPQLINEKTKNYETSLHLALSEGSFKLVKLLIDFKIDINVQDDQGYTALMRAIYKDKNSIAKYLIQKGADVKFKCFRSDVTALHLASANNDSELIRLLWDAGADINAKNRFNETPVMLVSSEAALDEFLKIKYLDVNVLDKNGKTVLMHCVENKFIKLHQVRALLAKGADKTSRDIYGVSAYEMAVSAKHSVDILELLGMIDNNNNHAKALRQVNSGSSVGLVAERIRDYAIPTQEYHKLISASLNRKNNGEELFWNYCIVGNLEGIKKLLSLKDADNEINFDLRNSHGETAFSVACALGHTSIVIYLLKYFEDLSENCRFKFDINSKNSDGLTAFQLSCKYDRAQTILALIEKVGIKEILSVKNVGPKVEPIIKKTVDKFKVKLEKDVFYNEEPTKKIIEDIENWQKEIEFQKKKNAEAREVQRIRDELFGNNKEELSDRDGNIFDLVDKKEKDDLRECVTRFANQVTFNDILNYGKTINITNSGKQEE